MFAGGDKHHYGTREPDREMIVKDLLTHTSGLTYGFMHSHPVDALYRARVSPDDSLETVIATLGELPLQFSPGTRWQYGMSTDVVGYLVQVLSGQPFDDYVAEHVTGPLGMARQRLYGARRQGGPVRRLLRVRPQRAGRRGLPPQRRSRHQPATSARPPCCPAAAAWSPPSMTTGASPTCCSARASSTASACSAARPSST